MFSFELIPNEIKHRDGHIPFHIDKILGDNLSVGDAIVRKVQI